jgi:rRNA processing protein Gar1
MKHLGTVIQIKKNGLVVQVDQLPKIAEKVFDDKENFVGNVIEFFGPTKKPFVIVSTKHDPEKYRGEKLFY